MALLGDAAPTLLSPGGAGSANQSQLNPQSPGAGKGRGKMRAPGTFADLREQGQARPSPDVLARQQAAQAQQAQQAQQPAQPQTQVAQPMQQTAQPQMPQAPAAQPQAMVAPQQPNPVLQMAPQAQAPAMVAPQVQSPQQTAQQQFMAAMGATANVNPEAEMRREAGPQAADPQAQIAALQAAQAPQAPEMSVAMPTMADGAVPGAPASGGAPAAQSPEVSQALAAVQAQMGGGSMSDILRQKIMGALNDPMTGLREAADSKLQRDSSRLGEQYDLQSDSLNENFAARGLDASTIAATGIGKLRGQQATALSDLAAQSNEDLLNRQQTAGQQAIANALGLSSQDLQKYGIDTNAMIQQAQMAQQRDQFGQTMGLQRDQFGYTKERDAKNFDYTAGRDAIGDARYTDQTQYSRGRDALADTRYTDETQYGRGRDALSDTRYNDTTTYNRGRDAVGDARYTDETQYSRGRDALGDARYTDQTTYNRSVDQNGTGYQQNRDKVTDANANTGQIMQIAQMLGLDKMSPAAATAFLASLGIKMPGAAGGATGSATGGGVTAGGTGSSYVDGYGF